MKIKRTRNGHRAMWERGGATIDDKGSAFIICGRRGEALKPVFLNHGKRDKHALIIIEKGYHVICVNREGSKLAIGVYTITDDFLKLDNGTEINLPVYDAWYRDGEWKCFGNITVEDVTTGFLAPAIIAGMKKSRIAHCKKPIYVKEISICK